MNPAPPDRPSASPRRPLSRSKRLLFSAIQVFLLYLVTELLVFVIYGTYSHQLRWMASIQRDRAALLHKLETRESLVLQVHPFVGYTEIPPMAACGDSEGKLSDCAVNSFGYVDNNSPIQARSPGKVIVGIMGGSVACGFFLNGKDRLKAVLEKDPAFAGKEIVFVDIAVSGYKQPQQLMTLNYLLALGAEFDVVINIDGFNDVVLYEAENAAHRDFPAFPRSWHTRVSTSGPRVAKYVGRLEYQVENREDLARGYSRAPWRFSPLCNLLWWIFDSRAEMRILALQDEYRQDVSTTRNYAVEGPGWTFKTTGELYRHLVSLWKNSSIQLNKICAANGIRYYHFLQPNLVLSGSKPLTPDEQSMADHRDEMYRPGIKNGYPLLIQEGPDLKARGVRFTDLTRMFDGHPEPIYCDICHFYQAGNDVMADRVAKAILNDFGKASQ